MCTKICEEPIISKNKDKNKSRKIAYIFLLKMSLFSDSFTYNIEEDNANIRYYPQTDN